MEDLFGSDLFSHFNTKTEKIDTISTEDKKRKICHEDELLIKKVALNSDEELNEESDVSLLKNNDKFSRATIHTIERNESCLHEVAVPKNVEFQNLKEKLDKPAREYPFVLDSFQKQAIKCIENEASVLVSAHTSAGKTVIAEYAIAQSLLKRQRVIYTSPIKALSNQKYREFYESFQDVGLQTGDVTINPAASCIVMTTEILRSMLYKGSEIMREVAWVVFDEIHYMRDKERGVVWEETIILLPDNVHYVFLSATIPNASQFAEWIAITHKQPCHVVYTDYRPTPLQHYIYPSNGDGLYLVVDDKGDFKEQNFAKALSKLESSKPQSADNSFNSDKNKNKNATSADVFKLVQMAIQRQFTPLIVFSFSKRECETYALQVSKLDLNDDEEKKLVEEVFNNAIDCLSEEDRKLPQIENVVPLLTRGIGIHHSGLLPIIKEVIEILFSEGLIKVLFATETFAMGLNMPARTVLFTSARKFDGKVKRWIHGSEYIQMSGRAGRRGLDDRGIVIMILDDQMSPDVGRELLKGAVDPLNSAFRLTYNMVLNMIRLEGINPEYMLEKSFLELQSSSDLPKLSAELSEVVADIEKIKIDKENSISTYFNIREQLDDLQKNVMSFIRNPKYLLPFMQPGRLVKIDCGAIKFNWGAVVNFQKKKSKTPINMNNPEPVSQAETSNYIVEILLDCSKNTIKTPTGEFPMPSSPNERSEMQIVPVNIDLITAISCIRLCLPSDLRPLDSRQKVSRSIKEVINRFPDGIPPLDPIEDMNIKDESFLKLFTKIEKIESELYEHPLFPILKNYDVTDQNTANGSDNKSNVITKNNSTELDIILKDIEKFKNKQKLINQKTELQKRVKKVRSVVHLTELKCRLRILRRLGFISDNDVIELKGRVACEINSADELVLTEMIFNGSFNDLTTPQINALLSCFIFQEKSSDKRPTLSEELKEPLKILQDTASRVCQVSEDAKIEFDKEKYINSFKYDAMDVVFNWSTGKSFLQICQMTDIFEGSIIRVLRRLEELLRQLCQAARCIGNNELELKFADGIVRIKRDIVFAASLYL